MENLSIGCQKSYCQGNAHTIWASNAKMRNATIWYCLLTYGGGAQIQTRTLQLFLFIIFSLLHGGKGRAILYITVTEQTFSKYSFIYFYPQFCETHKSALKLGSQTSSTSITWQLVRNAYSQAPAQSFAYSLLRPLFIYFLSGELCFLKMATGNPTCASADETVITARICQVETPAFYWQEWYSLCVPSKQEREGES